MTQILSGITPEGIMVATDSMATAVDTNEEVVHFPVDKLFSLGSHAFVVSGGMGISVELSRSLQRYVGRRGLVDIESITSVAGPYLNLQYREYLLDNPGLTRKNEELQRIFFLVGGYSFKKGSQPYQLVLWGSEASSLPLQQIRFGMCVAIPRTLSGEMRLLKLCEEKRPLAELLDFAQQFLAQMADAGHGVGPPFRLGTVTPEGFTLVEPKV
ncbi:MAG: hypothetical protein JRJ12_01720 [Deltaproteobacteria bacterium]|nr:hypothetical protein [Deltaproteobacteria bacterium]MBW2069914.1 hypothetical protein [Deltaproteobacteria bacterium]